MSSFCKLHSFIFSPLLLNQRPTRTIERCYEEKRRNWLNKAKSNASKARTRKYFILQLFVLIILNISRISHAFQAHFRVALRQCMNHFSLWKRCIPLPAHGDSLEHRSRAELCDYAKVCLLKGTDFSDFTLSTGTSVHKLINSRGIYMGQKHV